MRLDPADLSDRIAPELLAAAAFRKWLFDDGPKPVDGATFTFTPAGVWATTHNPVVQDVIIGGSTSTALLSDLRPLCFSTSFKILDMTVEWMLNLPSSRRCSFKDKQDKLLSLGTAGSTPATMAALSNQLVYDGFRQLYGGTTDIRHAIVHRPHVTVVAGTDISGPLADGTTFTVTHEEQRAFVRFASDLGLILAGEIQLRPFHTDGLLRDLHILRNYHQQVNIGRLDVRMTRVVLILPRSFCEDPAVPSTIDLDALRSEKIEPIFADQPWIKVHFDLEIRIKRDEGDVVWRIPEERVPAGTLDYGQLLSSFPSFLSS